MMIIDFHTHTFPEKIAGPAVAKLSATSHSRAFTDATNRGLLSSMAAAGIDLSVILPVATAPRQVEHINDAAAAVNSSERRLLSFGCMHPDYEEPERELERIRGLGIPGIKIHPVYQDCAIDDPKFIRILRGCAERNLIVVMHSGADIGFPGVVKCSPQMTRRAADAVPEVTLVLAHMGGWRNWEDVPRCLKETQVFLDTSFCTGMIPALSDGYYRPEDLPMLDEEGFMAIADAFGAGRLVFGTDSPWDDQRETADRIGRMPLDGGEKRAVFSGNALELLRKKTDAAGIRLRQLEDLTS